LRGGGSRHHAPDRAGPGLVTCAVPHQPLAAGLTISGPLHRGPMLPYNLVAGVVPCARGWLVVGAKVLGVTIAPEPPRLIPTFLEVLDDRPAFTVVCLYAPVGRLDEMRTGGRVCAREARALLGPLRGAAIRSAPTRAPNAAGFTPAIPHGLAGRYEEVERGMAPYRQRTVFEV